MALDDLTELVSHAVDVAALLNKAPSVQLRLTVQKRLLPLRGSSLATRIGHQGCDPEHRRTVAVTNAWNPSSSSATLHNRQTTTAWSLGVLTYRDSH